MEPLRSALELGLSYTPLAFLAIESMEDLVSKERFDVLAGVLPLLNEYLMTDLSRSETSRTEGQNTKQTVDRFRKISRVVQKTLRYGKQTMDGVSALDFQGGMKELRMRIIKLIGSLGGHVNLMMSESNHEYMAWDPEKRISFEMPWTDLKVIINFG